jgi:uncharacterized surface protein with fasciclin (FAS1) repeats
MKHRLLLVALLVCGLCLTSLPTAATRAQTTGAYVRFVHLSADTPAVKLTFSGKSVTDAVEFGSVTPYIKVDAGKYKVLVQLPDAEPKPDAGADFEVTDGKSYSVTVTGLNSDSSRNLLFIDDAELVKTALGTTTLPDKTTPFLFVPAFNGDAIDIYVNDKQMLKDVKFGSVSILAVPLGRLDIKLTKAGDANTVLANTTAFGFNGIFGVLGLGGTAADKLQLFAGYTTPQTAAEFFQAQAETDIKFNSLLLAAKTVSLLDALSTEGPFTILAPSDAAWAAVFGEDMKAQEETFKAGAEKLATLFKLHILEGRLSANALIGELNKNNLTYTAKSLAGDLKFVYVKGEGVTINGTAKPFIFDIQTSNAVIHIIDSVMVPAS